MSLSIGSWEWSIRSYFTTVSFYLKGYSQNICPHKYKHRYMKWRAQAVVRGLRLSRCRARWFIPELLRPDVHHPFSSHLTPNPVGIYYPLCLQMRHHLRNVFFSLLYYFHKHNTPSGSRHHKTRMNPRVRTAWMYTLSFWAFLFHLYKKTIITLEEVARVCVCVAVFFYEITMLRIKRSETVYVVCNVL